MNHNNFPKPLDGTTSVFSDSFWSFRGTFQWQRILTKIERLCFYLSPMARQKCMIYNSRIWNVKISISFKTNIMTHMALTIHLRMFWPNSLWARVFNYSKNWLPAPPWPPQTRGNTLCKAWLRSLLKITSWNESGIDIIRTAWLSSQSQ